jgi:diguanylate cyclase (GGDEF)-like protein
MNTNDPTRIIPLTENNLKNLETYNACLIIIHGMSLGKKINLDKDEMSIGRAEDVDIRINEDNVSRKHAVIIRQENCFIIEDNKSTNGTFINTKRKEKAALHDQDLIMLGNTILKFISSDNLESAYHEELYKLATLDNLLQIYNKTYFLERLQDEFNRCCRYDRDLSFIMCDVDHFKRINDVHGHQTGDCVLKKIASIMTRKLREEDILGRYGGEEFAVILPETNAKQATIMAERLRKLIENADFTYHGKQISVTISLGVVSYKPLAGELHSFDDLIERADQAMYKAKNAGRNRVECYNATMSS